MSDNKAHDVIDCRDAEAILNKVFGGKDWYVTYGPDGDLDEHVWLASLLEQGWRLCSLLAEPRLWVFRKDA